MIFVTVGSNPTFRFDRLIEAIGQLDPSELVVQYGPAKAPRGVSEAYEWLTFDQVVSYMSEADTVISHAGMGTIICAAQMGHVPVVMPRLRRYNEIVDDHQVRLAKVFERTGRVAVVWDTASLPERVTGASRRGAAAANARGNGGLQSAVRTALLEGQAQA